MSTMQTIKATDLVRNLSNTIDQVRMTGRPLLITKGTQTVAELRPPPRKGFPVIQLRELFETLPMLGNEKKAMARDLEKLQKKSELPKNPWT